jgi:CRISPR/Cas system CSM-associated protein Csm3 (group 7 of RAMP superfamily)
VKRFPNLTKALTMYQLMADGCFIDNTPVPSLKGTYRAMLEQVEMEMSWPGERPIWWRARFTRTAAVVDTAHLIWSHLCCDLFGHRMKSTSYATPETAVDSYHCTRCGMSFTHTYY